MIDQDTQCLIYETIKKFVDEQSKKIEQGSREEKYNICPHCKTEIFERHEYTEDGGKSWRHSDCGGKIEYPETTIGEYSNWLQPFIKSAMNNRKKINEHIEYPQDKEMMNLSGEAKYSKEQPGGQMASTGLLEFEKKETNDQSVVDSRDYIKLFDGLIRVVNLANIPLKFSIDRISVDTADSYIIKVSNA